IKHVFNIFFIYDHKITKIILQVQRIDAFVRRMLNYKISGLKILIASTADISGTAFFIACSKLALKVIILISQYAYAHNKHNLTILLEVMSLILTSPPSDCK